MVQLELSLVPPMLSRVLRWNFLFLGLSTGSVLYVFGIFELYILGGDVGILCELSMCNSRLNLESRAHLIRIKGRY